MTNGELQQELLLAIGETCSLHDISQEQLLKSLGSLTAKILIEAEVTVIESDEFELIVNDLTKQG